MLIVLLAVRQNIIIPQTCIKIDKMAQVRLPFKNATLKYTALEMHHKHRRKYLLPRTYVTASQPWKIRSFILGISTETVSLIIGLCDTNGSL